MTPNADADMSVKSSLVRKRASSFGTSSAIIVSNPSLLTICAKKTHLTREKISRSS